MILKLSKSNPTTCFMVGSFCDTTAVCGDWDIIISESGCPRAPLYKRPVYIPSCDCTPVVEPDPCPEKPSVKIRYPAFEINSDGSVCFMWDNALWELPRGRYRACLRLNEEEIQHFGVDLHTGKPLLKGILNQQNCITCEDETC